MDLLRRLGRALMNRSMSTQDAQKPALEPLEDRSVPATFTVTNVDDSGEGSLRQAIADANAAAGADVIQFSIAGDGVHTISLKSALPYVTDQVTIDGTTEAGYDKTPVIELNGAAAGDGVDGLVVAANDSVLNGLAVNRFSRHGVLLAGNANTLINSHIGTDTTGYKAMGNEADGVAVLGQNNVIGAAGEGNLISGNGVAGVDLFVTSNNVVRGNRIGTNIGGTVAMPNAVGVVVNSGSGNVIGGAGAGQGNLISGNTEFGVELYQTVGAELQGNTIGAMVGGNKALANVWDGVAVFGGNSNRIGIAGGAANVISGNGMRGVAMVQSYSNVVENNHIGTNADGSAAVGNALDGVSIMQKSTGNIVGANVLSGNGRAGVVLYDGVASTTIQNNLIGVEADQSGTLGNAIGVWMVAGSHDNAVGGVGVGNVIGGNAIAGVEMRGAGVQNNVVAGNSIGASGATKLSNLVGVSIADGASGNTVGGAADGLANHIVYSGTDGVSVAGAGTNGNLIAGNLIGNDGTTKQGNTKAGVRVSGGATNTLVGGTTAAARNVVSGNLFGVVVQGAGTAGTTVQGNYIGLDSTGEAALANTQGGLDLLDGASGSVIGGTVAGSGNVISGNGPFGVRIRDAATTGNALVGNIIGLDALGAAPVANSMGVIVNDASSNAIGGATPGAANVIAGNRLDGITMTGSGNSVLGNFIGTNAAGKAGIGNGEYGINVAGSGNVVGGASEGARNVISGNVVAGVHLIGSNNLVQGNYIGLDPTGVAGLANGDGVVVEDSSVKSGANAVVGNTISGNYANGVYLINARGDLVQGNFIGVAGDHAAALGNRLNGVSLINSAENNSIGGTGDGAGNLIANNGGSGVLVNSGLLPAGSNNTILRNSIYSNGAVGIRLGNPFTATPNDAGDADTGPNGMQNAPLLASAVASNDSTVPPSTTVVGTLNSASGKTFRIEFFASDPADGSSSGRVFLGATTVTSATNDYAFTATLSQLPTGKLITATATALEGTSEFSSAIAVEAPPPVGGPPPVGAA